MMMVRTLTVSHAEEVRTKERPGGEGPGLSAVRPASRHDRGPCGLELTTDAPVPVKPDGIVTECEAIGVLCRLGLNAVGNSG
jgi:hypothetical protein